MALLPNPLVPAEIRADQVEVKLDMPPKYTDEAALSIMRQDLDKAQTWMEGEKWKQQWKESDILYQSPSYGLTNAGGVATRSNVSRFTVLQHVNSLGPSAAEAIFADPRPFVARPRPGTSAPVVRAKSDLIAALLDEIEFAKTCKLGVDDCALQGTKIYKWGWEKKVRKRKLRRRKNPEVTVTVPLADKPVVVPTKEGDEFVTVRVTETINRPYFECCELGAVIPAAGWRHPNEISKAAFVFHVVYMTLQEISDLRKKKEYDIPPMDTLKEYFFGSTVDQASAPSSIVTDESSEAGVVHAQRPDQDESVDPMLKRFQVIERTTPDTVMVTVENRLIIRNNENELGKINFYSFNWFNIPRSGWGIGAGRIAGGDQRIEQGALNVALDILSFAANQTYISSRGSNPSTQDIRLRLGGQISVTGDPSKAYHILPVPQVAPETWAVIQNAQKSAEAADGADSAFTQGQMPSRGSSIGRTATGAGGIAAASAGRIQGPVGRFVDYVLLPFLYDLEDMIRENMPPSEIRAILADEYTDEFEADMESLLNARLRYECLAGANLAAKKAMAQSLPLILQVFENQQLIQQLNALGEKVNVAELFAMILEISGWKNNRDIITKMTPQEQASYTQNNPATAGLQAKLAVVDKQNQGKIDNTQAGSQGRIAEKMLDNTLTRAVSFAERDQDEQSINSEFAGQGV